MLAAYDGMRAAIKAPTPIPVQPIYKCHKYAGELHLVAAQGCAPYVNSLPPAPRPDREPPCSDEEWIAGILAQDDAEPGADNKNP